MKKSLCQGRNDISPSHAWCRPHLRINILRHGYCFLINFLINLFLKAYQEIAT